MQKVIHLYITEPLYKTLRGSNNRDCSPSAPEAAILQHGKEVVLISLNTKPNQRCATVGERGTGKGMSGCVLSASGPISSKTEQYLQYLHQQISSDGRWMEGKQTSCDIWQAEDVSAPHRGRRAFFLPPCFMSAAHLLWALENNRSSDQRIRPNFPSDVYLIFIMPELLHRLSHGRRPLSCSCGV